MKRFDPRIVFGFMLIVGGGLALAQALGYLNNASEFFWGGLFLAAGLTFLTLLFGGHWWSAFPGFTLAALGTLILLPDSLDEVGGAVFLGGIALSFWYVYLTDRVERWWAMGVQRRGWILCVAGDLDVHRAFPVHSHSDPGCDSDGDHRVGAVGTAASAG